MTTRDLMTAYRKLFNQNHIKDIAVTISPANELLLHFSCPLDVIDYGVSPALRGMVESVASAHGYTLSPCPHNKLALRATYQE